MREAKATDGTDRRKAEKETVQWVLGAPSRLEKLLSEGKEDEATNDWEEIRNLLDTWEGAKGVAEIRQACEKAMKRDETP
jgi:hypothetical protein